jgi:hypothetical protein
VVEGTSLENWRRVTLFVSSNLTASARICTSDRSMKVCTLEETRYCFFC